MGTFASSVVAMVILSWPLTVISLITVPVFFWLTRLVPSNSTRPNRACPAPVRATRLA